MNWSITWVTVVVFALSAWASANAQTHLMNELDYAQLPAECSARLRGDPATAGMWRQRIGEQHFLHLHHYCFGLFFLNRGMTTLDKTKRNASLKNAVSEFQYVIDRWPPNSPYRLQAQQAQQRAQMLILP